MFGRKGGAEGGGFGGFLAEGTEVDGDIRFADELRIDGKVTGRILSEKGRLTIGEGGNVSADVEVGTASVGGTVTGTLIASVKVEIHATGKVFGNIQAPALIIEEGAVFEGRCEMAKGGATQDSIAERRARTAETEERAAAAS